MWVRVSVLEKMNSLFTDMKGELKVLGLQEELDFIIIETIMGEIGDFGYAFM
ncbi:hypothetical protein MANES_16G021501v8 [Manihot esculenta]|uniref:Uncharacterized protein n=1 Tax=Manihot esculenta TaxID=3983 RepID=A0ACB7G4Z6_MANES|nr:hypothetical protein MANES_16G021501v8 [Manihot esculenta]